MDWKVQQDIIGTRIQRNEHRRDISDTAVLSVVEGSNVAVLDGNTLKVTADVTSSIPNGAVVLPGTLLTLSGAGLLFLMHCNHQIIPVPEYTKPSAAN